MNNKNFNIRPAKPEDIPFIMDLWLNSFYYHGKMNKPFNEDTINSWFTKGIRQKIFYPFHRELIKQILMRSITMIACSTEDPDHIYGFLSYERVNNVYCIHYIVIKKLFWKNKIAKTLLGMLEIDKKTDPIVMYSHITKRGSYLLPLKEEEVDSRYFDEKNKKFKIKRKKISSTPKNFYYNPYCMFWSLEEVLNTLNASLNN